MKKTFIGLLIVALIVASIWVTIDVWQECRQTNSFFYCLKLVSK